MCFMSDTDPANCDHVNAFDTLAIPAPHALDAGALPAYHADPFDGMLIAQARIEGLTLITVDGRFAEYDVALLSMQ